MARLRWGACSTAARSIALKKEAGYPMQGTLGRGGTAAGIAGPATARWGTRPRAGLDCSCAKAAAGRRRRRGWAGPRARVCACACARARVRVWWRREEGRESVRRAQLQPAKRCARGGQLVVQTACQQQRSRAGGEGVVGQGGACDCSLVDSSHWPHSALRLSACRDLHRAGGAGESIPYCEKGGRANPL